MKMQTIRIMWTYTSVLGHPEGQEDVENAVVIPSGDGQGFAFCGDTVYAVRQNAITGEWHGSYSASASLHNGWH